MAYEKGNLISLCEVVTEVEETSLSSFFILWLSHFIRFVHEVHSRGVRMLFPLSYLCAGTRIYNPLIATN
jgi:hypothetical protein